MRICMQLVQMVGSFTILRIELVLLTDSANTHDSRGIEMYLHKKFYEKLEDLMVGLIGSQVWRCCPDISYSTISRIQ